MVLTERFELGVELVYPVFMRHLGHLGDLFSALPKKSMSGASRGACRHVGKVHTLCF